MSADSRRPNALATPVLCAVFFLSGCAALLFETLWFRLCGLTFGNGLWASAIVLSSFMAGLAVGNGIVARMGARIRRPVRLYALIEVVIAVFGVGLVLLLPALTTWLTPLFRAFQGQPEVQNALRVVLSFGLLCLPAITMGMTLPLLVKALRAGGSFGGALGKLYGWNTLGAVCGALLGELALVEAFGVLGTSLWAGLLDLLAAAGALAVARSFEGRAATAEEEEPEPTRTRALGGRTLSRLAAAGLAGGSLLALEVVWFRFLQLFIPGTTLTFSIMLSVVLAGIGIGGLATPLVLRLWPNAYRAAAMMALAAGAAATFGYVGFDLALGERTDAMVTEYGLGMVPLSLFLMLPTSVLSGVLFTLLGQRLQADIGDETRTAGLLTMANTIGATLGPLVAGFLLLPRIGMEASFALLAGTYGLVSLLLIEGARARLVAQAVALVAALALLLGLFPWGRMQRYLDIATAGYRQDGSKTVAVQEGVIDTIQYLEKRFLGEPYYHRLVTGGYSMSGTHAAAQRYMQAYVYWPVAFHPGLKSACLISFGCGSTAKSLTNATELESIDVVDISREILDVSDVVFPDPKTNPLNDPRVQVHVEDGRFFLQTSERRFDLITSEPPPPKVAGVVNLYTREYFQLIHDRLTDGGVSTYWLPVVQLDAEEARSIMRAWVDVFGDEASLWTGCGLDWMLVGTKNMESAVSRERFEAQWGDPVVAPELERLGFETPAQLVATFLMGPESLAEYVRESEPVTDGHPKRLSSRMFASPASLREYDEVMDVERAREDFERCAYTRRLMPPAWRERSLAAFRGQGLLNGILTGGDGAALDFEVLHELLRRTPLVAPIQWSFGSDGSKAAIAARKRDDAATDWRVSFHLAVSAMAKREFLEADRLFDLSHRVRPIPGVLRTRLFLRVLSERHDLARALLAENREWFEAKPGRLSFIEWLGVVEGFEPGLE